MRALHQKYAQQTHGEKHVDASLSWAASGRATKAPADCEFHVGDIAGGFRQRSGAKTWRAAEQQVEITVSLSDCLSAAAEYLSLPFTAIF